jgi:hypothetical protein
MINDQKNWQNNSYPILLLWRDQKLQDIDRLPLTLLV